MPVIHMLLVGLIVGILARFFYPGAVPINLFGSIAIGVLGSLLAGFVAQMTSGTVGKQPLRPAGCIASILGAMVLIFIARHFLHLV
ncbi:MAG: GlsB/YeaQ/YmgE family stress response membrane protein [Sphingomonas bacterium]